MIIPNREDWIKKYTRYIQRCFQRTPSREECIKEYYKHYNEEDGVNIHPFGISEND